MLTSRLDIHQTWGQISITQLPAVMNLRQPPADLQVRQTPATLNIHTENGQVFIDQTACFSEEGLKSSGELARQFAQEGQQTALAYIGETATDGDQLQRDIRSGTAIAQIAERHSAPQQHEFNVALVPSSPVKFLYKPAQVNVDVRVNRPDIQVNVNHIQLQVEERGAKVQMLRYPSISIQVVGGQIDTKI
jgi:hypothetical protein